MTWLSHPYRRFILLGALLYAGMAWLGYQTTVETVALSEWNPATEHCQATDACLTPPEMTADTVAITHYFKRDKAILYLLRSIEPVTTPEMKAPKVARRIPSPPPPPPPPRPQGPSCGGIIFSERLPIFPGCDEMTLYEEHKACGEQKLLEFIYANIRYPVNAREESCAGTAVIEFVVQRNGRIEDAEIIADPGCGLGAIALKAVAEMNKQGILWIPGHQHGVPIVAKFRLPVRFKLG